MALEDAGFAEPNYVLFGWLRESALNTWQRIWVESVVNIAILLALLTVLTLLLIFQDTLGRSRRWHAIVRVGFLSFVLIWLGWIAGGQLSVINLFSYGRALIGGFDPLPFLVEPVILIVAVYTALSLLLLGRGVFCGWLCPYGALQELANRLARLFRVPQLTVSFALNEKLWAIKYVAIVALVGLAGYSMDATRVAAEIEPFKTAITLKFERA
jgi:NosR/NirI family nitrous oxide reductase transcriptional regulator